MKPEDINKLADEIWEKTINNLDTEEFNDKVNKLYRELTDENGNVSNEHLLGIVASLSTTLAVKKSFNMSVELMKKVCEQIEKESSSTC